MKAHIKHNQSTNTVHFSTKDISFIYRVPDKIKHIKSITDYGNGFITMQTKYGEEYTNLIEMLDQSTFPEEFKHKAKLILVVEV